MQKLHFERDKHRGYWNIGEMRDGGELGWAPGHDILFPLRVLNKYEISPHLLMSGRVWQ